MRVKADGSVDGYDDYYPYGMVMNGRSQTSSADARYKFTGKERDAEINYDYLGHRYYDYRIGRLLSVDRFADKFPSLSPYSYAANNPIIFYDANGDSTRIINNEYTVDPIQVMGQRENIQEAQVIPVPFPEPLPFPLPAPMPIHFGKPRINIDVNDLSNVINNIIDNFPISVGGQGRSLRWNS